MFKIQHPVTATPQYLVNLIHSITAKEGLWEVTHAWVGYECVCLGCQYFQVTLMLVHVSSLPKETFNITFDSKQQYGTKITCSEVRGSGGSHGD